MKVVKIIGLLVASWLVAVSAGLPLLPTDGTLWVALAIAATLFLAASYLRDSGQDGTKQAAESNSVDEHLEGGHATKATNDDDPEVRPSTAVSKVDRIEAEAEKRRQRARELDLPSVTTNFYREYARYFPAWEKTRPELIPETVSEIREPSDGVIELICDECRLKLGWTTRIGSLPDGDYYEIGTLTVDADRRRVFEMKVHVDADRYFGSKWRTGTIEAFIEGEWVAVLQALATESNRLSSRQAARAAKARRLEEAEELKRRFDIE